MTNPDWLNKESEVLAHVTEPNWEYLANHWHKEWLDAIHTAWKWEDRYDNLRRGAIASIIVAAIGWMCAIVALVMRVTQ